ncbi:hypothetical protein [Natronorubrum thiooxidans]|uniref:Uncharacterized protein n=1 Tax=Natronorubrum thiooxidans TaxID=308853 RepID=A0A1N7CH90_9EURY|nr:hypothetical protein [Natronorubrum thiooxidans]SIR62945.1 hypothetical protein SAMN05421752_101359 [Natronorubrum thiooxidans]
MNAATAANGPADVISSPLNDRRNRQQTRRLTLEDEGSSDYGNCHRLRRLRVWLDYIPGSVVLGGENAIYGGRA